MRLRPPTEIARLDSDPQSSTEQYNGRVCAPPPDELQQKSKSEAEIAKLESDMLQAINVTTTESLLEESDVFNMLQVRAAGPACCMLHGAVCWCTCGGAVY